MGNRPPSVPQQSASGKRRRVLVVGAGATGSHVAHYLAAEKVVEVAVWEQSATLGAGGALHSVPTASGVHAELGAQVLSFEMLNDTVESRHRKDPN